MKLIPRTEDLHSDSSISQRIFERILYSKIHHFELSPPQAYGRWAIFGSEPTKKSSILRQYYEDQAFRDSVYAVEKYNFSEILPKISHGSDSFLLRCGYNMMFANFETDGPYLAGCKKLQNLPNVNYPTNACPGGLIAYSVAMIGIPNVDLLEIKENRVWHLPALLFDPEMIEHDSSLYLLRCIWRHDSTDINESSNVTRAIMQYGLGYLGATTTIVSPRSDGSNRYAYIRNQLYEKNYDIAYVVKGGDLRPSIVESKENLTTCVEYILTLRHDLNPRGDVVKCVGRRFGKWRFWLVHSSGKLEVFEYAKGLVVRVTKPKNTR